MTKLLAILGIVAIALSGPPAYAQQQAQKAKNSFNYQAVARDAQGKLMANQKINVKISITHDANAEVVAYSEVHQVTTDQFGLFHLKVGRGIPVSGQYDAIDWGQDQSFLQVEMDVNATGDYALTGTSEILSVPYALQAKEAETLKGGLDGLAGSIWHDGQGEPEMTIGRNNDYYLDITSAKIYKKIDEAWQYRGLLSTGSSHGGAGGSRAGDDWLLDGNAGTSPTTEYLGTSDASGLSIRTNATEAIRIADDQKVGVGTSSPQGQLHLKLGSYDAVFLDKTNFPALGIGTTDPKSHLHFRSASNGVTLRLENTGNGGKTYAMSSNKNGSGFGPAGSLTFYDFSSSVTRALIDSSGNFGINVTDPDKKLEVATTTDGDGAHIGNSFIGRRNSTYMEVSHEDLAGTASYGFLQRNDGTTILNGASASSLSLRIDGSSKLHVAGSTGYVGIGNTAPSTALDVTGTTTTDVLQTDAFTMGTGAVDDYILQTDGTGSGTWTNSENAVGWRRATSTTVYNTGDSVGINTNDPLAALQVMGSTSLGSILVTPNEPFSGDDASIILAEDDDDTYHMEMTFDGGDNRLYFYGKNNMTLNGPHMGINRDNGRVGIGTGTANPASELEVVGTITATAFDAGDASGLANVYADSLRGSMQATANDIIQWDGSKWTPTAFGKYAFHASASTDQTVGDTAYDTLRCNNSSSGENFEEPAGIYDNVTYAFEAPVDGIYFFEAAVLWDNTLSSEVRNAIFIRVNNTDEVGEWSVSGGTDFFGTGISTTLELNAGDEVRIRVYNGDANDMDTFSQGGKYCYFSGFLVYAQ